MYRLTAAGIALATCALAACAGPVAVPPATPSNSVAASECTRLIEALPSSVLNSIRRKTEPSTTNTAAWGDPPITLRCGVQRPSELEPTSTLITIDGVDWLPVQRSAGYVFTTVGRGVYIEVAVPNQYAPETSVLPDLASAITTAVPADPSAASAAK